MSASPACISWIGKDLPAIVREGRSYFLLGHGQSLYLVENLCPHRGGALKFGFINADGALVCPLHGNAFLLETLIERPSTIRLQERGGE